MRAAELRFGAAVGDITPAPGCRLGGYWQRLRGADGVADPLAAKALVWGDGQGQAALVCLDLIALEPTTVQQLRHEIEAQTGIEAAQVMVCCSHTHAGPLSLPMRGMGPVDQAYLRRAVDSAAAVVSRAQADLRPGRLYYARPSLGLGRNRRGSGVAVPYAHAVFVESGDGPLATLFSYSCHPVHLGPADYMLSADFPGAAAAALENALGVPALFVNGACGDVNPPQAHGGIAAAQALGERLAQTVLQSRDTASALDAGGVGSARVKVLLPMQPPPSRWELTASRAVLGAKAALKRLAGAPAPWLVGQRQWAADAAQDRGTAGQPFEIQALRVGGLCLLGMEGELFARYQLDLEKAAPLEATLLCGYANGCIGYVPTADEYRRGGYEIEEAFKVYPGVRPVAPASEEVVREAALELLQRVGSPD